jgi:ATP-binding cassette subfamily B protein RaxB
MEHYGVYISNADLRRACAVTRDGSNLGQIRRAGETYGFDCTVHKKGIKALQKFRSPLILHWDLNHFVVLESINKGTAVIIDPAIGRRRVSMKTFTAYYTGVCLSLIPTKEVRARDKPSAVFEFLSMLPNDVKSSIGGSGILVVPSLILFLLSFLFVALQKVFFDYVVDRSIPEWGFYLTASAFILILILGGIKYHLEDHIDRIELNNILRVREQYLSQLMRKPIAYFEAHFAGELLNRSTQAQNFVRFLVMLLSEVGGNLVVTFICGFLIFLISPMLAIIMFLPFLGLMVWSLLLGERIQELSLRHSQETGLFHTLIFQRMEAFTRFYVMGTQKQLFLSCLPRLTRMQAASTDVKRCLVSHAAVELVVRQIVAPLTVFAGSFLITLGNISYGDFVIASFLGIVLTEKVGDLAEVVISFQKHRSAATRAIEVLIEPEKPEPNQAFSIQPAGVFLAVRDMGFGFDNIEPTLFCNVDLDIMAGEIIGLSGNSGTGKTTFLEVLSGQRMLTTGTIKFNGEAVDGSAPCGFVFADEDFLSGDLLSFIAGCEVPDVERISNVLAICELEERLGFFSDGSADVNLAEQGLSRGEIQRLSLAQALYRSTDCVLFDEAFSHVSNAQAARIVLRLRGMGTTMVFATHRPDVLALCDKVYVMDDCELNPAPDLVEHMREGASYVVH